MGLAINRAGKDYVSVKLPDSGMKLRFKGGIYAESWKPVAKDTNEESGEQQIINARLRIERLQRDYERVIRKRTACNNKRYPPRWIRLDDSQKLKLSEKEILHEPDANNAAIAAKRPQAGSGLPDTGGNNVQENVRDGGGNEKHKIGIAEIERYVSGCKRLVRELAEYLQQTERRRMAEKQQTAYAPTTHSRMR